jgi:UDP-N-acetylmuramate dehydrogenase
MKMTEPIDRSGVALRGSLRLNEPMGKHVSWRAGGAAARAYTPADRADLAAFLATLPKGEPVCFVGLGSNLLVRDGGYRGTVVLMHSPHGAMRVEGDLIYAEANVACPKLARLAAMHSFEGAEFLAGVPGTVGGALAMNAGCYGSETWDVVAKVQTISRAGKSSERTAGDFDVGYRRVELRGSKLGEDEWFLAAWLRFRLGDEKRARTRIKELLAKRIAEQPLELPNAGSVFRNPPGDHAARLVEASGLKGHEIGGARISEKHANFIVNPKGKARAADIEALIEHARDTVRRRFGVELVPEVRIIGEAA